MLALLLALAVVAVYYPVYSQPFANYDDPGLCQRELACPRRPDWTTVQWAMTARDAANWHPITWLSHALDVQLFGVTPRARTSSTCCSTSSTLYCCSGSCIARPATLEQLDGGLPSSRSILLMSSPSPGSPTQEPAQPVLFPAGAGRLPPVCRAAEAGPLCGCGHFVRAGAYVEACGDHVSLRAPAMGLLAAWKARCSPFAFALRQNTGKSSSGEQRKADGEWRSSLSAWRDLFWEKLPLLAMCGVSAVLTLNAQSAGGATSGYAFTMRLENAIISYARYLGDLFWPTHLALFYPYPLKPYVACSPGSDCSAAWHNRCCRNRISPSLLPRWMAVVFGNDGSHDRRHPSRHPGDG